MQGIRADILRNRAGVVTSRWIRQAKHALRQFNGKTGSGFNVVLTPTNVKRDSGGRDIHTVVTQ
jgi:hypothetical protein